MARRLPTIPLHWQQLGACVIFFLLFPLCSLLTERIFTGAVGDSSVQLVTSMYAIGTSVASRNVVLFSLGLVIGILFAVSYGYSLSVSGGVHGSGTAATVVIVLVLTFHLAERYNRHVAEREPFFAFMDSENGE